MTSSLGSPLVSQKKSRMSSYAPWKRSATAYTSVRLHVESTTTSRMSSRTLRLCRAFGIAESAIVIFSSRFTGDVRWLMPMTTMDTQKP